MAKNSPEADFERLYKSTNFLEILQLFDDICKSVGVDSRQYEGFFGEVKTKILMSWKCRNLWELFETKSKLPVYKGQKCCEGMRCLVIGAGPVGLRLAIEAALLGARVDVVEKREEFSRNNVLHLWPFIVEDLRSLGAKILFPRFCSGGIDHISESVCMCATYCVLYATYYVLYSNCACIELGIVTIAFGCDVLHDHI